MKTKITKGKWSVKVRDENENPLPVASLEITSDESDAWIAKVQNNGVIENKEGWANAKIIASAPDMLEALIQMRNYFGENDKTTSEHYMFSIADKTIKKATE